MSSSCPACPPNKEAAKQSLFRIFSKWCLRLIPVVLLVLLLKFPVWSVQGAAGGLLLWFNVVLPTLSPFIICTQTIIALDGVKLLMLPFYPVLHRIFGLSVSGAYVLFCGMLCGYPLGARLCADFRERKVITKAEADYLFSICNHPSPMFLLGYVTGQIPFSVSPVLLFTCLYLPILPLSLVSRRIYHYSPVMPDRTDSDNTSGDRAYSGGNYSETNSGTESETPPSLEDIIHSTCETMVLIGGYIMLFSILAAWLQHLVFLPPKLRVLLTGAAEITTGVNQICAGLPATEVLPAVIAAVAFGGFSGVFQTKSVTKNAGLSIRHYIMWKAAHACLSLCILTVLQTFLPR